MRRNGTAGGSLLLLLLAAARPAGAQLGPENPYLGVSAGPEAIPSAYGQHCGWLRNQSPTAGTGARATVGAELRPALAVESHLSYSRLQETTCLAIPSVHDRGVHTDLFRASDYDIGLLASELRLRFQPYLPWVLTGGAGWVWNHRNPYLVGGIGWRFGRRVQATLAAEVAGHRIAVDALTREWRNSQVVRVLSESREHRWEMGAALRVGLELHPR